MHQDGAGTSPHYYFGYLEDLFYTKESKHKFTLLKQFCWSREIAIGWAREASNILLLWDEKKMFVCMYLGACVPGSNQMVW